MKLLIDWLAARCSFLHQFMETCEVNCLLPVCFLQAPKTPLQKSMDLLGKQLSLYSFGIIGLWLRSSCRPSCVGLAVCTSLCSVRSVSCAVFQGSSCWWAGCRGRGSWTCSPSASGVCLVKEWTVAASPVCRSPLLSDSLSWRFDSGVMKVWQLKGFISKRRLWNKTIKDFDTVLRVKCSDGFQFGMYDVDQIDIIWSQTAVIGVIMTAWKCRHYLLMLKDASLKMEKKKNGTSAVKNRLLWLMKSTSTYW